MRLSLPHKKRPHKGECTMFNNKNFYPTPETLINRMLSDVDFTMVHTILEPSAGKGNIVDELTKIQERKNKWYKTYNFNIDCIELDENLRHILKGKNYRVVYNDFLTYNTMKEYDLIVMNPPFENGVKHLLKALEMQSRNGGSIVCLLNAETIKNQCTNERITLNRILQDNNAKIEFVQNAFVDSERKTDVEIALIKVQLPQQEKHSFIFDNLHKTENIKECEYTENTQVAENDFFKVITDQYNMELNAGIALIKEYNAMQPYILSEFTKDNKTGEVKQSGNCILSMTIGKNTATINEYVRSVRGKYWSALFHNPNFVGDLTENLRREYYNKIEELKEYDFSLWNISQIKIDMSKNLIKGIEETIISLFEELSNKYHYLDETSRNIHYFNGWKTNKCWIINKKVIIPLNAYDMFGDYRPSYHNIVSKLQDIEKCFNYLDGGLTESIDLEQSLNFAEEYEETKNIELKYFSITFYKKGTCHITFTNEELLKKFNIFGAQHKRWLPPCYGKKKYNDMTVEEKAVVNDFEGETEYNKVMNNTKYYLFDGNNLNLLETA